MTTPAQEIGIQRQAKVITASGLFQIAKLPPVPQPKLEPQAAPTIVAQSPVKDLASLLSKQFAPTKFVVSDLLPVGLSLLGGKPKMGKSWAVLSMGIAVASGGRAFGKYTVDQGDVLYLALEDNERRLQSRTNKLLQSGHAPDSFFYATEWPRLDAGGAAQLNAWLDLHPNTRLIIVDTLAKIKPRQRRSGNMYEDDYDSLSDLKQIADERQIAVVVVAHLRKADSEDPLDLFNTTLGLTGGVDGAMVLKRSRGSADAVLHVIHRELEDDLELAIKWDQTTAQWIVIGSAQEYQATEQQRQIIDALKAEGHPLDAQTVAKLTGQPYNNVRQRLHQMANADKPFIKAIERGKYTLISPNNHNKPNMPNNPNNPNNEL